MTLLKYLGVLAFFLCPISAVAQAMAGGDVTVRVLTLSHLHQLQLTRLDRAAVLRNCSACAARPAPERSSITAAGARLAIVADRPSASAKEIFADGGFRLQVPEQPPLLVIGKLHVTASGNQLLVRLTLPMEHYVAGVLNGETAPDEPLESLKAMAIVARTYAVMNRARHQAEGFDLCDDTHCQVMRFTSARPIVEQAVNETAGETLWYQHEHARVFFHQQCGGMTADVRDVWQSGPLPYLRVHRDIYCVKKSSAEWQSEVRVIDLQDALTRAGLRADFAAGALTVAARTDAGRARTLSVAGNQIPANTFRLAVNRALGWNTIKSDWYEIENRGDRVSFRGRGSGHGVGLCQIGAAEMAREGHDAAGILAEYFPGTDIGITADDHGWIIRDAGGFSVSSVDQSELQRASPLAAAAWRRALGQFPSAMPPQILVRIFPTVELFRQSTNQPGWVAASTKNEVISLEPYSILTQKRIFSPVLNHEFLHALVEAESVQTTPLWLREGLVEALSGEPLHASSAAWTIDRLETQLRTPASQASAAEAHVQAGIRVREYIRRYGLPGVRQWLRSGVPGGVLASSFVIPSRVLSNATLAPNTNTRHSHRD